MFEWNDQAIADLRTMYAKGLPASQIAIALGAPSRNSVCGKIDRLGLGGSRPIGRRASPLPRQAAPRQLHSRKVWASGNRVPSKPAAAPEPVAVDLQADHGDAPVLLIDVGVDQCRWPLGDPTADMMVCGGIAMPGHAWCKRHCRVAYKPRAA